MPPDLEPVTRRSVPDGVAAQIQQQILEGYLPVGSDLPGERGLAAALGVSRPTVREALRQLQQRGLVDIRQGGATTVRDYRRHGGLDLLPRLVRRSGALDAVVVGDIMRTRSAIGPQVARAAAEAVRDGEPAGRVLTEADAVASAADPVAQQHAALLFWDVVVDLSGSVVYRLLFNGLRRAYEPAIEALASVMAGEVGAGPRYADLAAAIAGGYADRAAAAATVLLGAGQDAVTGVLATAAERQVTG